MADLETLRFGCENGFRRDIWFLVADANSNFTDVSCISEVGFNVSLIGLAVIDVAEIIVAIISLVFNPSKSAKLFQLALLVAIGSEMWMVVGTIMDPLTYSINSTDPTLMLLFAVHIFIQSVVGVALTVKVKRLTEGLASSFLTQNQGFRISARMARLLNGLMVLTLLLTVTFSGLFAAIPFVNKYQGVSWQDNGNTLQQDYIWRVARIVHTVTLTSFISAPILHLCTLYMFVRAGASGSAAEAFQKRLLVALVSTAVGAFPGILVDILASDKQFVGPTAFLALLELFTQHALFISCAAYLFPYAVLCEGYRKERLTSKTSLGENSFTGNISTPQI